MLYERKQLPELNYLRHFHDDNDNKYNKYDETILNNSLTPYMYQNDFMNTWLNKMQPLVALLLDQMNIMKNWKTYTVDKYHWKQR